MRFIVPLIVLVSVVSSCQYVTDTRKSVEKKSYEEMTLEERVCDEQNFVVNMASLNYLEMATVLEDTIYVGCPSRRGEEHFQDNLARTFLHDMRKAGYDHIHCCRVISTSHDYVWSDSIVNGRKIGEAFEY